MRDLLDDKKLLEEGLVLALCPPVSHTPFGVMTRKVHQAGKFQVHRSDLVKKSRPAKENM